MATSRQTKPQWVYKKIVKDDRDFVGLIAYGLYKKRKSELANNYRKKGLSEAEITSKLKEFHDQEVQGNDALDSYRSRAESLLNDMLLKSQMSAKREAFECILSEAEVSKVTSMGKFEKFGKWLFSGLPSAVSTVVISAIVLGVLAFFASPEEKGRFTSGVVNKAVGEDVVQPIKPPRPNSAGN